MIFTDLGLANRQALKIDHVDDGKRSVMRCRIGSTSVMAKRTAASSDDLWVDPGERAVGYSADGICDMEVVIAGRFA